MGRGWRIVARFSATKNPDGWEFEMRLSEQMQGALDAFAQTGNFGAVRSTTIRGLERRGLIQREGDAFRLTPEGRGVVGEQVGRERPNRNILRFRDVYAMRGTVDVGQTNYEFWDRARRGQARGLERSGLFLKPLESKKSAWVLGQMPRFKLEDEDAQTWLGDWWSRHHALIIQAYQEAVGLGDCFIVVNPDGTVAVVNPDVVEPLVDENDYSQQKGWVIRQTYPHPTQVARYMTIEDTWTETNRVRRVYLNGNLQRTERYRNVLGRVPIVHVTNNRSPNEKYGRPEGEALLRLLQDYDEILAAGLEGNIKQGRPVPVAEMQTSEAVDKLFDTFGRRETIQHPDGTTERVDYVDFSSDEIVALVGKFYYAQPGSFSQDTEVLLGLMFYLFLQHTEIPEFIWGNAIQGSKASAETQLPPFVKWVEKQQGEAQHWVMELVEIALAYGFAFGETPVLKREDVQVLWESLTNEDGTLTLSAIDMALRYGLLTDETALALMPLDVDDPQAELTRLRAQQEEEARQQEEADAFLMPDEREEENNGDDDAGDDTDDTTSELMLDAMRKALA
jgi:hypothetical protein